MMNKQEILLRKRNAVLVPEFRTSRPRVTNLRDPRALAFQAEAMRLGYIFTDEVIGRLSKLSDQRIDEFYRTIFQTLNRLKGADVQWEPFYPNFPRQVMEASEIELFVNAIVHYWSLGTWRPTFVKDVRLPAFESVKFTELHLATTDDVLSVFTEIISANASVTETDREIMTQVMDFVPESKLLAAVPQEIPFKENLCWLVAEAVKRGWYGVSVVSLRTATDILRAVTHLSGGDISLAENTRFKSLPRRLRRTFVTRLEQVINKDDVFRHRGKWIRLAHSLHVGEFAKVAPKTFAILSEARSADSKYVTMNGRMEQAIVTKDRASLVKLLSSRPGVFARRLDHVVRTFGARGVVKPFLAVADQVDTRVLLQLFGHFNTRTEPVTRRVVFPKGKEGRSTLLRNTLPALSEGSVDSIRDGILETLYTRFSELPTLGKVYVDPALTDCPIPLNLRSASEGLQVVARGTKIPLGDGNTIRMFLYWKGEDIDLSAFFTNADFSKQDFIAYYNLRGDVGCHSGDITRAPNGACEFIDINIEKARASGHRYLCMLVNVFRGPNFKDHEICYAGWMTRSKVQSNEIFDPKTVEQRITLQCAAQTAIPVVFDLEERKAIWLDIGTQKGYPNFVRANNVHANKASLIDSIESAMHLDNKPTLYDLFFMHASARGTVVKKPEQADLRIGWGGDIKPTDMTRILAEFL